MEANTSMVMHGGEKDLSGNYILYGVREFGMSAIMERVKWFGGLVVWWFMVRHS